MSPLVFLLLNFRKIHSQLFKSAILSALVVFASVGAGLITPESTSAQVALTVVDADSIQAGDQFDYIVVIKKDQEYDEIVFPDSSHFGEALELIGKTHFRPSPLTDSVVYRLQFFGIQDVNLPALPITLKNGDEATSLETDPVPLIFKANIANEETQTADFKPYKSIFDFARSIWFWIVLVLGILLLVTLVIWLIKKGSKKGEPVKIEEPKEPATFTNPVEALRGRLAALKTSDLLQIREFKAFYTELTEALRQYYEDTYSIPALEQTTREFLFEIQSRALDDEMVRMISKILRAADMVKFAKFEPTLSSGFETLELAEQFANRAEIVDRERISKLKEQFDEALAAKLAAEVAEEEGEGDDIDSNAVATEESGDEGETGSENEKLENA